MAGTHYTLDRDRPENQNPMDLIKEKACGRCGTVKPNDFKFFGKKLWKTRTDLTTTDICITCQKEKVSASMKARWSQRKGETAGFHDESMRMALTLAGKQELMQAVAMREPDPEAEVVKPLDVDQGHDEGVKALSLEEAMDYGGTGAIHVDQAPETVDPGAQPAVRVETESERLMREFLTGG